MDPEKFHGFAEIRVFRINELIRCVVKANHMRDELITFLEKNGVELGYAQDFADEYIENGVDLDTVLLAMRKLIDNAGEKKKKME